MLAHHVFFWLNEDLTEQQKEDFRQGLLSLKEIEVAQAVYVGTAVKEINRPVVDTTYSFSLLLIFNDLAGHDVYQTHPTHKAFLDKFKTCWHKVVIYDAQ